MGSIISRYSPPVIFPEARKPKVPGGSSVTDSINASSLARRDQVDEEGRIRRYWVTPAIRRSTKRT
jgi:hypothetical protein